MKKATLAENLQDLKNINQELHEAIENGLALEPFQILIKDYADILENVRLAYNESHPSIINGIHTLK